MDTYTYSYIPIYMYIHIDSYVYTYIRIYIVSNKKNTMNVYLIFQFACMIHESVIWGGYD